MTWQNDRITSIPAPEPADYDRQYSFTDWEALHPANPKPASGLEAEFNAIQQALDETQARARLIQRSDGALANQSVGIDQLKSDVQIGVNPPTAWTAFTSYAVRDSVVFNNEAWYVCLVSHTSGADFATDLAAGKWQLIFDFDDLLTAEVQVLADEAAASAAAAAASADSLNLPALVSGDEGKLIVVNPTYDGYDVGAAISSAATASTVVQRDASGRIKASNPAADDDVVTKSYADALAVVDGSITTAKLADSAVTTPKIADEAVTAAKLATPLRVAQQIAQVSISGGAAVNLPTVFADNVFDFYMVVLRDAITTGTSSGLQLQVYHSGAYQTSGYTGATTGYSLTASNLNAGSERVHSIVKFQAFRTLVSAQTYIADITQITANTTSGAELGSVLQEYAGASTPTGFRILSKDAVNLAVQGTVTVYGSNFPF